MTIRNIDIVLMNNPALHIVTVIQKVQIKQRLWRVLFELLAFLQPLQFFMHTHLSQVKIHLISCDVQQMSQDVGISYTQ